MAITYAGRKVDADNLREVGHAYDGFSYQEYEEL